MAAETVAEPASPSSETFEFQAEVSRVMNLIINSLYSNKEVFLRELVSNASDACDKKRFLSLSAGSSVASPQIYVKADKDAGTVTIEDDGVGMTRKELINNLGSIATSGTSKFLDALGDNGSNDVSLIGQFGVGFYSAYLVADQVTVVSKSFSDPNAKQYRWESSASNSFTISEDDSEPLKGGSGTRIILHVKEGCKEFLENFKLIELMKRYSEFIQFPVYGWESRTEFDEVPDGDEKDEDGKQKMKRVPRTEEDWSQVNKVKPLWMRKPKEVKDSEYEEFYKSISRDFNTPLAHTHFAVEGDVEFRALLFCPKTLPPEFRQNMFPEEGRQLRLYVKRVFISDNFEDILPRWLCFLRGVIDSEDLPLNVSREILQKSRVLRIISKRLVRKAIDMFKTIKKRDNEDYEKFWEQFGRYLKAGIIEERDHFKEIAKLALWSSTNSMDKPTDLESYVSRMKENQKFIYYVTAESRAAGESAPAMERLRKLGYEVLFLLEPVDEIAVQNIGAFDAKRNKDDADGNSYKFVDVSKEDLNLEDLKSEEEKEEDKVLAEDFKAVCDYMTTLLSDKVGKVQISDRLTESVSTITQSSFGISPTMERYMREVGASTPNDPGMASFMAKARTLDINPKHPIVKDIKTQLEGVAGDENQLKQTCTLVYELALLTAGFPLDDINKFAKRVSSLVSPNIEAPEVVIPPKEEPAPSLADEPAGVTANELKEKIKDLSEEAGVEMDMSKINVTQEKGDEKVQKADTEIVE
ncbi:HSP90 [Gracilaria domingensis]|nr:HSP90 [Gracilaria domingensis]